MKIIKVLFLFLSVTAFAQSKVGTVDVDFILSKMPEIPEIQKQIEEYGKNLDLDYKNQLDGYNALVKEYTDGETGFTIAQKKLKQDEILSLEGDLNKFRENGSKLINIKRDELIRPLYQQIGVALEKIAQTEGFTQVVQLDETIVYADNNYDLTLKIITELGITLEEE